MPTFTSPVTSAPAADRPRRGLAAILLITVSSVGLAGPPREKAPHAVLASPSTADKSIASKAPVINSAAIMTTEQLGPLDEPQIKKLAESLIANSRAAPRAAVALAQGSDRDTAISAEILLRGLDDLAIVPLLEAPDPADPGARVSLAAHAVEAELELRRRVLLRLDAMVKDRSPVVVKTFGPVEEPPAPRRVCDEAYLMMRRMVNFGEPVVEASVQERLFLSSPDTFKDERIDEARATGIWNRAITGADFDDDDAEPAATPPSAPGAMD